MNRPLVIAGHASGVGKTTVATGIMGALKRRNLRVAPFKVGPDYIDPGYHLQATGVPSRNLDSWLTSPEMVRSIFANGSRDADVSVVEGVMGLFDGRAGGGDSGSTAEAARLIDGAVVLVVDCSRLARSLAPLLWGFSKFDGHVAVAGAILNKVGSPEHGRMLREAAREAGVPVLGEIPRRDGISLDSRHLGLVPVEENDRFREKLEDTIELVDKHVDIEALLAVSEAGAPGRENSFLSDREASSAMARIAVARDEAFSFYYVDSMEALEAAGAELVYFSPLHDMELPACDGLYLGGGFPEMFAGRLEKNATMRRSVAAAVGEGMPTYAECGGMVYLCRQLEVDGRHFQMAGAMKGEARMTGLRQALGYVEARARSSNILMKSGERIRGHEFHWSEVKWQKQHPAYDCNLSRRPGVKQDGFNRGNLLASYVHIHFGGNPMAAARYVAACAGREGVAAGASV